MHEVLKTCAHPIAHLFDRCSEIKKKTKCYDYRV